MAHALSVAQHLIEPLLNVGLAYYRQTARYPREKKEKKEVEEEEADRKKINSISFHDSFHCFSLCLLTKSNLFVEETHAVSRV